MNAEAPKLYGTIKIHKQNLPIKPVVYSKVAYDKCTKFTGNNIKDISKSPNSMLNSIGLLLFWLRWKSFRLISFDLPNI